MVGPDNRLLSDGLFNYEYDAEGNRIKRTNIATGYVTEYTWDLRNRLTQVIDVANQREHHRVRTFQEEYRAFLVRHGIEFDEQYVWG